MFGRLALPSRQFSEKPHGTRSSLSEIINFGCTMYESLEMFLYFFMFLLNNNNQSSTSHFVLQDHTKDRFHLELLALVIILL